MQEVRSHYAVRFRLDRIDRFLIWYSADTDGVLLSSPNRIHVFPGLRELALHAAQENLRLEPEAASFYDFDRLNQWLEHPTLEGPDCRFLLDAWNILRDIALSLRAGLSEPSNAKAVYDKLFWGSNLPSMTPPGEHFEPRWSNDDILVLTAVLSSGLKTIRGALKHAA